MKKLLFCLCALFLLHCTEVPDYGVIKVGASPAVGGTVQRSPEGPEYKDGTVVTLVAKAEYGYEFVGWSGNVSEMNSSTTTITVKGDDMVIANFVQVPNAPYSISAKVNSAGGIVISWSSVSNATGYYIYRNTTPSGSYTKIGLSDKTSYVDYDILQGATYYYNVSAYNGNVEGSQYATPISATTPPSAPTSISATVNTDGDIVISWPSVSNATKYYIYRSTTSSGTYTKIDSSTTISTTNSYTDKTANSGTTYYYKVSASNSGGEGLKSNYAEVTTRPSTPTGVSATVNSNGDIVISWSSVSNATGYYIYRSTTPSGSYTKIGTSSTTPYTDYNVAAGTTYYYKVSAYNSGGEGTMSNYDDMTTRPSTPTSVNATSNSENSININWSSVPNATEYYIYRSTSPTSGYTQIGNSYSTSYTSTGLLPGTTYYYKVSASNSGGEGPQSSYTSATTRLNTPTVSGATGSTSGITVYWYSVSNAAGYYIYRSTSSSGSYTQVGNAASSSTSWIDTNVASGTYYYYRVSAYSSSGVESSQSTSVSAAKP